VASITYPSGRTVTYGYSGAGRVTSASDTANSINFASDILYAPQGAFSQIIRDKRTSGFTGITATYTYRNLLQLDTYVVSSSNGTVLDLDYSYNNGSGVYDGNVYEINNLLDTGRKENFSYDYLRRLKTAKTAATSGTNCWGLSYSYDAWATAAETRQGICLRAGVRRPSPS
jgi:YD repeat-containing protein